MARAVKGQAALAAADPVMARLIERIGPLDAGRRTRGRPPDAYGALLRTIVGQQLSVKAARTIHDRVLDLFGGRTPTPAEVLAADPADLRGCGLSGRKAEYLRDLATHVLDGQLEIDRLGELPDEDVIAEITAIRGLGRWSAEMFLMFTLGRPDVLPVDDVGIRRAIMVEYDFDAPPTVAEMEAVAEPWRPHRTLACLYLWESLDNAPA